MAKERVKGIPPAQALRQLAWRGEGRSRSSVPRAAEVRIRITGAVDAATVTAAVAALAHRWRR